MKFMAGFIIGLMLALYMPKTFFRYWFDDVTIMEGDRVGFRDKRRDENNPTNCKAYVKGLQAVDNANLAWLVFVCERVLGEKQVFVGTENVEDLYRKPRE